MACSGFRGCAAVVYVARRPPSCRTPIVGSWSIGITLGQEGINLEKLERAVSASTPRRWTTEFLVTTTLAREKLASLQFNPTSPSLGDEIWVRADALDADSHYQMACRAPTRPREDLEPPQESLITISYLFLRGVVEELLSPRTLEELFHARVP